MTIGRFTPSGQEYKKKIQNNNNNDNDNDNDNDHDNDNDNENDNNNNNDNENASLCSLRALWESLASRDVNAACNSGRAQMLHSSILPNILSVASGYAKQAYMYLVSNFLITQIFNLDFVKYSAKLRKLQI